MVSKVCTSCGTEKLLDDFPQNSKGKSGRASICKSCSAEVTKKYREDNPIVLMAKKYGIGLLDDAASIYSANECEICGVTDSEAKIVVDHDHKTGLVRGKLCDTCNKGLGQFHDSIDKLVNAIVYLKKK